MPLSPTGTFTFDYQYDQSGLYTVKVKVTDDDGGVGESTVPVRVEVDNDGLLYLLSWRNRRLNVDVDAQTLRTLFPEVGFNQAIDTFETISLKTEDRQMYDARDKAARDHQWLITLDQSPTFVKLQD